MMEDADNVKSRRLFAMHLSLVVVTLVSKSPVQMKRRCSSFLFKDGVELWKRTNALPPQYPPFCNVRFAPKSDSHPGILQMTLAMGAEITIPPRVKDISCRVLHLLEETVEARKNGFQKHVAAIHLRNPSFWESC